jgi:hypothetical protein
LPYGSKFWTNLATLATWKVWNEILISSCGSKPMHPSLGLQLNYLKFYLSSASASCSSRMLWSEYNAPSPTCLSPQASPQQFVCTSPKTSTL